MKKKKSPDDAFWVIDRADIDRCKALGWGLHECSPFIHSTHRTRAAAVREQRRYGSQGRVIDHFAFRLPTPGAAPRRKR